MTRPVMQPQLLPLMQLYSKAVQQELANELRNTNNDDEKRALLRVENAFKRVEQRMEVLIGAWTT